MNKLTCDVCGGKIIMQPGGQYGECCKCGLVYTRLRLAELLNAESSPSFPEKRFPRKEPSVPPVSVEPAVGKACPERYRQPVNHAAPPINPQKKGADQQSVFPLILAGIIVVILAFFALPKALYYTFVSVDSTEKLMMTIFLLLVHVTGIICNYLIKDSDSYLGRLAATYASSTFVSGCFCFISSLVDGLSFLLLIGCIIVPILSCVFPSLIISAIANFIYRSKQDG